MQAPISANTMTVLKYSSETSHVAHISSSDSRASSRYRSTTVTVYYRSIRLLSAGLERAMQPLAEKERRRTSSLVQAIERVDGLAAVPCDRGIDRHEHRAQTAGRKAYLIAVDGHGSASGASASRREKKSPPAPVLRYSQRIALCSVQAHRTREGPRRTKRPRHHHL